MNGFINLCKESGITSNKALSRVKTITGCKKAGFLGTLDPCATGVLPIGLGFGTKIFPFFEKTPKTYEGEIIFGAETDTQDATGTITRTGSVEGVSLEKIEEIIKTFTGEIEQLPPMFSAKKVKGKRLYEMARKGKEVEREAKKVTVHSIEIIGFSTEKTLFRATVSTGTYIRTLCEDIGKKLGTPAHMGKLTRTKSHVFGVEDGVTLEQLTELKDSPEKWLLPLDYPLEFMERCDLNPAQERNIKNGSPINWKIEEARQVRLYGAKGQFLGIGRIDRVVRKLFAEKLAPR